jgi:6-pyruvoyltetrahydropterin/6-carboxytetrahydropterin synthase
VLTCRQHDPGSVEVRYRERRYLLPVEDVVVLPICNTSAENLATWVGSQLRKEIEAHHPRVRIGLLRVMVEETPGQRGVFHWVRD